MSQILTIRNHVWFPLSMQKFMKEKLGPDADFAWARDQIRRGFAGKPLNFLCNNNYSTNSVTWEESLAYQDIPSQLIFNYLRVSILLFPDKGYTKLVVKRLRSAKYI